MATFSVPIVPILSVDVHPNADRLEIATVLGYQSIIGKGQFKVGDLVAYIPEGAVLPADLLEKLGLTGKLCGAAKNRVKAVKLRQVLSQGICMDATEDKFRGHSDVAEILGITKYEPPIPACMKGEVLNVFGHTFKYDVENFQMWPNVLVEGEEVIITEKIHGTFFVCGYDPDLVSDELVDGCIVASKGVFKAGLSFKHNEANQGNIYVQAALENKLPQRAKEISGANNGDPVYIMGELHGSSIQGKYSYGHAQNKRSVRIFDIKEGDHWMPYGFFEQTTACDAVPVLYRGPFSVEVMKTLAGGPETVSGTQAHIREGVVVHTVPARSHMGLGRVKLKYLNPEYLGQASSEDDDPELQ